MRQPSNSRSTNRLAVAYVGWREACRLVDNAYRSWVGATRPDAPIAFGRYTAALDAEERAANVYADLVSRVGHATPPTAIPCGSRHDRTERNIRGMVLRHVSCWQ
jgi:hypothetical protein